MAQSPSGPVVPSSRNAMVAMAFAVVSLVLFALAVSEVVAEWGYPASILAGAVAVVLGWKARTSAADRAGPATVAVVLGGILIVLQLGWLVLEALGVVTD